MPSKKSKLNVDKEKETQSKPIENIGKLLNKNNFKRYSDGLLHGYIPKELEKDIELIENIPDKIILLEYVKNQLNESIEWNDLALGIYENQEEKYNDDKDVYEKMYANKVKEMNQRKTNFQKLLSPKTKSQNKKSKPKENQKISIIGYTVENAYDYILYKIFHLKDSIGFARDSISGLNNMIKFWKELLHIQKLEKVIIKSENSIPETPKKTKPPIIQESLNIKWLTNDTDLYYLIRELFKRDEIKRQNLLNFVKQHFIEKKGKPFANKPTTQGTNNLLANTKLNSKSQNGYIIDEIILQSKNSNKIDIDKLIEKLIEYNFIRTSDKNKLIQLKEQIN